jgi:hypothetical protein
MTTLAHLLVDILSTAPGLVPVYRAHLAFHDELLPHVFMAEITHWITGSGRLPGSETAPGGAEGSAARELVGILEAHLESGDAEVRELIVLSFLENLDPRPGDDVVRSHFGPTLRAEAARLEATGPANGNPTGFDWRE